MAEPIFGRKRILMFRKKGETEVAKLALQITHTWDENNEAEQKQTKDGPITVSSGYTAELSLEAVDSHEEINGILHDAMRKGDKIEVWDVDLTKTAEDDPKKYLAIYAVGVLSTWSTPNDVESTSDFSTTLKIDGIPQSGYTVLPEGAVEEMEKAYNFVEIVPTVE